jgi:DNA-binding response OmpR family regulator
MVYVPCRVARKKILLVDDSPIVRAVVAHTLRAASLEIECVDHPTKLAAEVTKFGPELLLVDASYPGVTDDDLIALVQPHTAAVPVVLFSDRSQPELDVLAQKIGAKGSVPKDGATLLAKLEPFLS